ncbi:MAG: tryptophan synthase subunit alpha, partial [Ignavibacteriales bacterium]
MSHISEYIVNKNRSGEKILSVFLTAGFPDKNNFVKLALDVLNAGVDMLEIGFPFSDPLADGPVIQYSSQKALENGVTLKLVFEYVKKIREKNDKPLILMGYANPVLKYGKKNFALSCSEAGVNGLIIPDVPVDESEDFFDDSFNGIDKIFLASPTTPDERLKQIDNLSSGFLYYVSMAGTTGRQLNNSNDVIEQVKKASSIIKKNKMLVGFGISNPDDVKSLIPYCSGVIVGS